MAAVADLQPMAIAPRAPGDYAPAAGVRAIEALREAAGPLRGARVLHVSAAGAEGRIPEFLGGLLPLAAGAGVEVEWRVLFGSPDLRATAAALQSGLRGGESAIEEAAWAEYLEACAGRRPLARRRLRRRRAARRGARPRRGLRGGRGRPPAAAPPSSGASTRMPRARSRTRSLAPRASRALLRACSCRTSRSRPRPSADDRLHVAPPGIDPLDPRNLELESRLPGRVVRPLGVDLERPFCLQVLELDRWDDPHAAIDAFRVAKAEEPDLQLVLAALLDRAATESWQAAKEISDYAADTDDVLLLTTYEGLGSLEVGALLLLARAVIERSLREGFELAPFEALWKRTPVVGGLPIAVRDGVDGFLAPEPEQAAARIIELVRDPGLAIEMGRAGRERVRERFLVTSALERELHALAATVQAR